MSIPTWSHKETFKSISTDERICVSLRNRKMVTQVVERYTNAKHPDEDLLYSFLRNCQYIYWRWARQIWINAKIIFKYVSALLQINCYDFFLRQLQRRGARWVSCSGDVYDFSLHSTSTEKERNVIRCSSINTLVCGLSVFRQIITAMPLI